MTSFREKQLIADVLNQAHLAELPKVADGKKVWIEAIAKIKLRDGSVGYGIIKRNPDLTRRVTYINGNTSAIAEVMEVYPYEVLQPQYIKKFTAKEKENARINYLKSLHLPYLEGLDMSELTIEELNRMVVQAAVYMQLRDMEK